MLNPALSKPKMIDSGDYLPQASTWTVYEEVLRGRKAEEITLPEAYRLQQEFAMKLASNAATFGPNVKAVWASNDARFATGFCPIFSNTLHSGSLQIKVPASCSLQLEAEVAFVSGKPLTQQQFSSIDDQRLLEFFSPHLAIEVIDTGEGKDRSQSGILIRAGDCCFATVGQRMCENSWEAIAENANNFEFSVSGKINKISTLRESHSSILRQSVKYYFEQSAAEAIPAGATFLTGAHSIIKFGKVESAAKIALKLPSTSDKLEIDLIPSAIPAPRNDETPWNAATYSQHARPQLQKAAYLASRHVFRGNEIVWDLGCGDGNVAMQLLAPMLPEGIIVGVDKDPDMISQAISKLDEKQNVHFVQGDITKIEKSIPAILEHSGGRAPDIVFCNSVLNYCIPTLEEHLELLKKLAAAMAPDSTILLSFTGMGNFSELENGRKEARSDPRFSKYFESYLDPGRHDPGTEEYIDVLIKAGFAPLDLYLCDSQRKESDPEVPRQIFTDCEEAAQWFATSVKSHMKFLEKAGADSDTCIEFARQVIASFIKAHPERLGTDGSVELDNVSLIVRAKKS